MQKLLHSPIHNPREIIPGDFQHLLRMMKEDIVLADSMILPNSHPLKSFQKVSMRAMNDHMITFLQAMRGASKSYLDARYCLDIGFTHKVKIVYTGPTFRQALHVFEYLEKFIEENSTENNPLNLASEIVSGPSVSNLKASVVFKNGTEHVALPMGNGENIRGERADILVIDEFFNMQREMYKLHILPFLLGHREEGSVGPKLILSTSAEYADCFAYHLLSKTILPKMIEEDRKVQEDPNFHRKYIVLDWNIDDVKDSGYQVDDEVVELMLKDSSDEERQQALYNKWVGTSGEFFPKSLPDRVESPNTLVEYKSTGKLPYILAIDVATALRGDRFIIHVGKVTKEKIALVNTYWGRGLSSEEMAWKIHEYNELFNPSVIVMDKGGGGLFVLSTLGKKKLIFPDGSEKLVKHPLLEHDETGWLSGDRKVVLNYPTDMCVRGAFSAYRSRGGEFITTEDMLSHLLYDSFRQYLSQEDIPLTIPQYAGGGGDDERSEIQIVELIKESIKQLRHLKRDVKEFSDGTKEIVRSGLAKVPRYIWKNSQKDAGVALCYLFLAYLIHNKDNAGWEVPTIAQPLIRPAGHENVFPYWDLQDHSEGQLISPYQTKVGEK